MENGGSMLKRALVVIVLVAAAQSGLAEKLASCCTRVNSVEITEPIIGFLPQAANPPCVTAVIFQTKSGLFCSQVNAPWVRRKIVAFMKAAKAQSIALSMIPSSTPSLLSIITSTAFTSSSSTLPSSSTTLPSSSTTLPSSSSLSPSSPSTLPSSSTTLPSSPSLSPSSPSTLPSSSSLSPSSPSTLPSSPSTLPSSSSLSPSSIPSTSEMPAGETFSETATSSVSSTSSQ
ncbi:A-agglutinin anchorage subunit-like isoform X2 [Cottoperca gobio]|uniref:A-agglutinin anchorage subunit-like isoform X2 n=1 Tax=Cottoperca gobio TaxID=56716 RepID=A0A6J2RWF7_COTGO|nr:A-agglutinin anchorage subunit-like isoform X2 [Cottoperca gobio]